MAAKGAAPAVALSSGHRMPAVGLGVWRMEKPAIRTLILSALRIGYRHLDCAADYQNEAEVGDALAEAFQTGLVKREDLFITTKLWNSDHGHVIEACKDSLKKLQLDYLDLYLVHFPVATRHTGVGTTSSALGDDGVLDIDTTISLETTWHCICNRQALRQIEVALLIASHMFVVTNSVHRFYIMSVMPIVSIIVRKSEL